MNDARAKPYSEVWCRLAEHIWSRGLIRRLAAPGALQRWEERAPGRGAAVCVRSLDDSSSHVSIYLAEKSSCSSLSGLCLGGTDLEATGSEQSLGLVSLDSRLGLYFQTEDFLGVIKPLKNAPLGSSWDDCMTNLSHKARVMLPWHQRENCLLVSTLALVQCLMPKPKAWVFSTFKWI